MAWADLTPAQKEDVKQFFRDFRPAIADIVRGLRALELLTTIYNQNVSPVWATIAAGDVIEDENGLANSGTMKKSDWGAILTWASNVHTALYGNGGASGVNWPSDATVDQYGVLSAGPNNIS